MVKELERYKTFVAALQKTKWFNDAVYMVGESIVIAAGRPTPLLERLDKREREWQLYSVDQQCKHGRQVESDGRFGACDL